MWRKTGFVFVPSGENWWAQTHATVPIPWHLGGDVYRIYFCTRDELNRNRVGYVEVASLENPKILCESQHPVLGLGELGHFDCDGIYATCLRGIGKRIRMYYAGWNAGVRGVFYSAIGIAESDDCGRTFVRRTVAPALGRDAIDPWACMAPFVVQVAPTYWLMWYASGISLFKASDGGLRSLYDIKSAESTDGIEWAKTGKTSIPLQGKDTNIARPCVLYDGEMFRVWYPYVAKDIGAYRIGYGESTDGIYFRRMDKSDLAMLHPSTSRHAWDCDAVTYPYVFRHKGSMYMLYNGNEFGRTGFGLAVWEEE